MIRAMQLPLMQSLMAIVLTCLSSGDGTRKEFVSCLPPDTDLEEVVSVQLKSPTQTPATRVTVRDRLRQLKAHCKKGKLVDSSGREIRFYRLLGCWGNPPADYQEQLAQQEQELQRLKKKYKVVEIPCGQMDPRQIQ